MKVLQQRKFIVWFDIEQMKQAPPFSHVFCAASVTFMIICLNRGSVIECMSEAIEGAVSVPQQRPV